MNHLDRDSKVIAVTGASTGLGRGIAVGAARLGMRVVVGDLGEAARGGNFDDRPELTTAKLIASQGGEALFVGCDVTKADEAAGLVEAAVRKFGDLDVLVNNAGVWRGGPFHELPEAAFDACWSVIAKGTWLCSRAAVRHFLSRGGGSIINVVSTAGLRAHRGQSAYNAAKAAQASLTTCLALEYADRGIRVNGVCPTFVKTAMSRGGFEHAPDAALGAIPVGRWGEIADVVQAALFLASDEAAFLTGVLLPVDGGETLEGARRG
ncbi:MAG: SDR family NAD(P)-dependent oxidoreductase [Caulobacteraceae bacterium]